MIHVRNINKLEFIIKFVDSNYIWLFTQIVEMSVEFLLNSDGDSYIIPAVFYCE